MPSAMNFNVRRYNAGDKAPHRLDRGKPSSTLAHRSGLRALQAHRPQPLAGACPLASCIPALLEFRTVAKGKPNRRWYSSNVHGRPFQRAGRRVDGGCATWRRKEVDNRRERAP